LTVCPLSNIKLKVFGNVEAHNIKRLLERGLCVTVNSDDPAYFGGYVLENYLAVERGLGLSRDDLTLLARNSIEASFLTDSAKQRWFAAIADYARNTADRGSG
jgi:adenine deaminase